MGDNAQTWSDELARRCEAVGFVVTKTKEGFRILGPEGNTTAFHRTMSAIARRKVMSTLRAWGLDDRELAMATQADQKRKANIAADRKANATRLQETVKLAKKATGYKPAGEYAVHDDEDWPLRKHTSPACRLMVVTPALAEKMLAFNDHNRRLRKRHAARLGEAMDNDDFILTHQGYAFDTMGRLLDGQHRLTGQVASGKTLVVFVFVGIDPRAFAYIDIHARRGSRDVLEMEHAPNAAQLAAVLRHVYLAKHASVTEWIRTGVDNSTTTAMYAEDRDAFDWATRESHAAVQMWRGYPGSCIGALIYLAHKGGASDVEIDEFLTLYKWGENIARDHPIAVLRRTAKDYSDDRGRRVRNNILYGQLVCAWNALQEGRTIRTLHRRYDDPIPPLTIRK